MLAIVNVMKPSYARPSLMKTGNASSYQSGYCQLLSTQIPRCPPRPPQKLVSCVDLRIKRNHPGGIREGILGRRVTD